MRQAGKADTRGEGTFPSFVRKDYLGMSNPITVKGYVCSVPRAADARQASVAVVQDDVEYRIIPRGAGADLADEVSALVEVTGLLEQVDEVNYIQVRGYTLVDDTSSWDDDE